MVEQLYSTLHLVAAFLAGMIVTMVIQTWVLSLQPEIQHPRDTLHGPKLHEKSPPVQRTAT